MDRDSLTKLLPQLGSGFYFSTPKKIIIILIVPSELLHGWRRGQSAFMVRRDFPPKLLMEIKSN